MQKNESKKPLWAQNQPSGRKTRKKSKKNDKQMILFDVETTGYGGNLVIRKSSNCGYIFDEVKTDDEALKEIGDFFGALDKEYKLSTDNKRPSWAQPKPKELGNPTWAHINERNAEMYKAIVEDRDPEESLITAQRRYAAAIQEVDARMQKFRDTYGLKTTTAGYMAVVPDSHFWSDLDMLRQWAKYMPESKEKQHLIKGLDNTKANGYSLVQLGKEHAKNVPGTFSQHYDYIQTFRQAMPVDEFVKTFLAHRPTKIFCKHWSTEQPLYTIHAHYDFVQTRLRKQTPSVRIQAAFEDKAQRIYLPALYRKLTTENQHRMPFTSLIFE